MTTNKTDTLDDLRQKIDDVDGQILKLLNQRMEFVREVGTLKQRTNTVIYRPEREKAIIDRLTSLSQGALNRTAIEAIFLEVFAVSRNIELPERVAYLGPEGSFTHQAAEVRFGAMSEYLPLKTIRSVFDAVETDRARFGVVPVENNQEGIVSEAVRQLKKADLKIVAEIPMPIHFSFATTNEKLGDIKKIYSKDIAFKQCRQFIKDHFEGKGVELIPVDSTSKAAKLAMAEPGSAAICSHIAAKLYNLPMLFANIEDSKDNYTRFFILGKDFINQQSGKDKTTIIATTSGQPGSLVTFLQEFYQADINLTKIESHPAKSGKKFNYWFYIEFDGHFKDEKVEEILERHKEHITWLGSYVKLC